MAGHDNTAAVGHESRAGRDAGLDIAGHSGAVGGADQRPHVEIRFHAAADAQRAHARCVLPVAAAITNIQQGTTTGKLVGVTPAATPTGWRRLKTV